MGAALTPLTHYGTPQHYASLHAGYECLLIKAATVSAHAGAEDAQDRYVTGRNVVARIGVQLINDAVPLANHHPRAGCGASLVEAGDPRQTFNGQHNPLQPPLSGRTGTGLREPRPDGLEVGNSPVGKTQAAHQPN